MNGRTVNRNCGDGDNPADTVKGMTDAELAAGIVDPWITTVTHLALIRERTARAEGVKMDQPITDEERAWAQGVLDAGDDTNVHLLSYCRFLTNPAPGTTPVRNDRGGITGYADQAVTDEIARLRAKEAEHLAAAEAVAEPELKGGHNAVAQNYRLARMTRETDAAYAAQTFELDAVDWYRLCPEELRQAYTGKSQGMWPHQRAGKDDQEIYTYEKQLMALVHKDLSKRKLKEDTAARAKTLTDGELAAEITRSEELDTIVFLALVKERDARTKRARAARTRSQNKPASPAPFTEDEELLLASTAAQTAKMTLAELRKHRTAFADGSTRGDQLKYVAVVRELTRRGGS